MARYLAQGKKNLIIGSIIGFVCSQALNIAIQHGTRSSEKIGPTKCKAQKEFVGINQDSRLKVLKEAGFQPSCILDAGANQGRWTQSVKQIFPEASFLMLEANEYHREVLQKVGVLFKIAVLGATDGKQSTFYMTKHPAHGAANTGASMFREMSGIFDDGLLVAQNMSLRTIDSLVSESVLRDCSFNLVKLDLQGAEIEALKGAKQVLKSAAVVFLELSVVPYNMGAPLWFEVHLFMESIGYAAADITELHYGANGFLIQVDVMFSKKSSVSGVPPDARPTGFGSGNLSLEAKSFIAQISFNPTQL